MVVKKIVFLIILLFSSVAYAQHKHEFYTDQEFSVRWDADTNIIGWEWYIQRVDGFVILIDDSDINVTPTIIIPSAGVYVFYVRAWNHYQVTPPERTYSSWANSLTHGKVDGVDQAWQIKINLKPVGPLQFFDEEEGGP